LSKYARWEFWRLFPELLPIYRIISETKQVIDVNEFREQALSLVKGAYDLHTHSMPSHFPRVMDDFALLRQADAYGMAGIMFKNHYEPTTGRVAIANQNAGVRTRAYGGLALNWTVGGINPYAVEACLLMGGQMVWMPTFDSAQFIAAGQLHQELFPRPGLTVFDEKGKMIPKVYEIFDLAKKYDVFLATGHLSAKESFAFCKAGKKENVKLILTHPDFQMTPVPFETQSELADMGVVIEKAWFNVMINHITVDAFADSIKKLGTRRVLLVTDRGQAGAETPPEALINAVAALLENGLTGSEIENLIRNVPETIIKK
jgi:hypothetical protein